MCNLITYIGSAVIGFVVATMGYGVKNWQFWVLLSTYVLSNAAWMIKAHINQEGD